MLFAGVFHQKKGLTKTGIETAVFETNRIIKNTANALVLYPQPTSSIYKFEGKFPVALLDPKDFVFKCFLTTIQR